MSEPRPEAPEALLVTLTIPWDERQEFWRWLDDAPPDWCPVYLRELKKDENDD